MQQLQIVIKTAQKHPLTCLCVIVIWILCFCTPPHTPLDNVPLIDKWTHIVMYAGTCGVLWAEHLRLTRWHISWRKMLLWAWLAPVVMSGIIELLQAYCTGGRRSGDWLDFLANGIGVTLAFVVGGVLIVERGERREERE